MENNITNVEEKNVDINKSLMRKTKVELVNIILRKDDIETKLRKEIKNLKEDCIGTSNTYKDINNKYENLKKNYEEIEEELNEYKEDFNTIADENADLAIDNIELDKENKKYKVVNIILFVFLLVSVIFNILR